MTTLEWTLLLLIVVVVAYLFWRLRGAEDKAQVAQTRLAHAREQASLHETQHVQLGRYLSAVSQVGSQAILLVDASREVVWANDAVADLGFASVDPPVPLNRTIDSYEVLELVDWALGDDLPHERQIHRDAVVYRVQALRVQPEPALVALTLEDVTELQRLGRARRDFVANISHDLRTPITAIQIMVETLQGAASISGKKQQKLLQGIADQTASLQQLAQELLDLSLIESGRMPLKLVETTVTELIDAVVERMRSQAERKQIVIRSEYDPSLLVLADAEHVCRVLQNLVHNAIKFSEEGREVLVGAEASGEDVRFFVQDSGPGVDPEDAQRIFERFFKADRMRTGSGTGLGLAIVRHIVEGHGGEVWVESQPGQGATFYFTLLRAS